MLHKRTRIAKHVQHVDDACNARPLAKTIVKSEHCTDVVAHGASHVPAEFLVRRRGGR